MANKTKIEWTETTWNPIRGCSRVSEGCRNCYAEGVANRFKGEGQPYEGLIANGGRWNGKITVAEHLIDQPFRWRKPRMIFVNSMSDLFHENVPNSVIDQIFAVMAMCPHHTFQILTKRPERMHEYINGLIDEVSKWERFGDAAGPIAGNLAYELAGECAWPLPNVWLGVSVEDQATADERIPLLLQTPAAVRWISAEPLLDGVWLPPYLNASCKLHKGALIDGQCDVCSATGIWEGCGDHQTTPALPGIDWVVVGGESGKNARPMHPDWVRSLRDQCAESGTPFFFKQWGEWAPYDRGRTDSSTLSTPKSLDEPMQRFGKKAAGRLLDGALHDEYPAKEVTAWNT